MTPEEAIDIVARHAIYEAAISVIDDGWEDYPEIGEGDWDLVGKRVVELTPDADNFAEAYLLLEARANKEGA